MISSATVVQEQWPLAKPFIISRGAIHDVTVVLVELGDGDVKGRGESCPVPHFGESLEQVVRDIEALLANLAEASDPAALIAAAPAGAARNAVDCAFWDLRAKRAGKPIAELLGIPPLEAVETVMTVSLDAPDIMAAAARAATAHPILKLKLGAAGDGDRLRAVRAAVPEKRLIVDVNEGWSFDELREYMPLLAELGIEMVEQPLRAGEDDPIAELAHLIPVGADESCHTSRDLDRVAALYDVINIKLDKTGGLTEALALSNGARARGLDVMVGCMLGTSLAMAPATVIAQSCRFVDLDAPLLIGNDRVPSLTYADGKVSAPQSMLWG